MTQPNSYYQTIADNGWFVFFAYFFAFAAWSAVSGNDFISSSWKTVGETRRRGQLHLFVVTVPMLYMTTYIYFQFKIRDFKEMNAAIVALGFAVLHLFRTVWGLWQLHVFKQWLVASIKSIESLGYKSALYGKGASDSSCLTTPVKVAKTSSERYEQINREVDYVRVNDTIVENRLSEGEVKCYLRFLTAKQKREVREAGTAIKKVLKALRFGAQNCFRLLGIIWPLAFSSSPMFSNRDSAPFLDPTEPEELWLRWATVLVSHAIPDWLVDMNKACATERKERGKDFDSNRDRFASEVLISTALHSRSTDKVESQITEKAQGNVVGGEPETFSASHKFLPFGYWKKFPKLCSGRFSKQEFLERACTTGNGLPFNAPHPLAKIGEGDDVVYSYRLFASKLYRAREELPADDGERVKKLGIDELEWLSIFLSVEDWSTSEGSNEHIADGSSEGKKPDPGAKIESNEHSNVELTGSDISVANLSDQLGFGVSSKTFFERFSIPFLTKSAGSTTVWGNRNVLELSVHVDNWLALCSGDQVTYMEEKSNEIVSEIPPASPTRHQVDGDNVVSPDQAVASDENIWRKCVEFERKRLMFQFSVLDPEHSYFDQSLTFLGANMENLRSSLARWVEINHDTQHSSWEPSISPEIAPSGDEQAAPKQEFMIKASRDFENCLWSMQSEKDWSQRYVQMRLLWELQSGFQNMLPKDGVCPNQTEAMILCILSFPSICIDVKAIQPDRQTASMPDTVINIEENQETVPRKEEHEEAQYTEETFSIEDFELLLRAAHGPQKCHINVSFSRRTMGTGFCISVRLCNEEPSRTARFVWEAWRDSFAGGLEGMRQWQEERKFSQQLPLLRSTEEIGAGIFEIDTPQAGTGAKMKTWRGWIPHRASVCKYEIMNDGFILHRKKTGVITTNAKMSNKNYRTKIETPREQTVPVRYDQADRNALKHASVVVHGYLLRVSKNSTYAFTGTDTVSTDLRSRADAMYNDKNGDRDMALLLYEISATETGDLKALQKAVSMLIKEKRKDDNQSIERAVALMERFYISGTNTSNQSGTAYNRFQENEWVTIVKTQYCDILRATGFIPRAAKSYADFCIALSCYSNVNMSDSGIRALSNSIVYNAFSKDKLSSFTSRACLEGLIDTNEREMFVLGCFIHSNFIRYADEIETKAIPREPQETVQSRMDMCCCFNVNESTMHNRSHGARPRQTSVGKKRAQAQNRLAILYFHGAMGIPKNPSIAKELYEASVAGGNVSAMNNLALLLLKGDGAPSEPVRAKELFLRAIEESDSLDAMNNLAMLLEKGADGVDRNPIEAVELYNRAIKKGGHVNAIHNLAILLKQGASDYGLSPDPEKAEELLSTAVAAVGEAGLMHDLAGFLDGAETNPEQEVEFYTRAIAKGDVGAMMKYADLLATGSDEVKADKIKAMELYERAINEHESAKAMYRMAVLLDEGVPGVRRDRKRIIYLLEGAIEKEHTEAKEMLKRIAPLRTTPRKNAESEQCDMF